jgi:hypothetical protein
MRIALIVGAVALVTVSGATALYYDGAVVEEQEGLLARATVTPEQARLKALAAVPGAKIIAIEIEQEDGKLIYTVELKVPGQRGITDVEIDGLTGAVLQSEHDDEDDEDDTDHDGDTDDDGATDDKKRDRR